MVKIKFKAATPEELEAQLALQTFGNYFSAWARKLPADADLTSEQERLPGFRGLMGGADPVPVQAPLRRGFLTLRAMQALPIARDSALATVALYWAPVQAYYAVHGFGLAVIAALQLRPPEKHTTFRHVISRNVITPLCPYPFSAMCSGIPRDPARTVFASIGPEARDILSFNNLTLCNDNNAEHHIGKSLLTTRKWFLESKFDEMRHSGKKTKGRSRKNVPVAVQDRIALELPATTFVDWLYRLRVKTNYDSPDMFIFNYASPESNREQYDNILRMVQGFKTVCTNILRRKLKKLDFEKLVKAGS